MSRASLDVLTIREYWTPAEAALVLGRGRDFWSARYDAGDDGAAASRDHGGGGAAPRGMNPGFPVRPRPNHAGVWPSRYRAPDRECPRQTANATGMTAGETA